MLIMGLLAAPLALFDILYVPSYWLPKTLFDIPIGIEGFIFSFEIGALATGLFAYSKRHSYRKGRAKFDLKLFMPFAVVLPVAFAFNAIFPVNIAIGMYVGLIAGIVCILYLRKDLLKNTLIGMSLFGVIYFLAILIWANLFPYTTEWFTVNNLPRIFIYNVPLYEIIFGFLFAAFWGGSYPLLFRYELAYRARRATGR